MDLDLIQIHLFLRFPNKGFGSGPSNPNPNPKIQTGCQQIDTVICPRTYIRDGEREELASDQMQCEREEEPFFFFNFWFYMLT